MVPRPWAAAMARPDQRIGRAGEAQVCEPHTLLGNERQRSHDVRRDAARLAGPLVRRESLDGEEPGGRRRPDEVRARRDDAGNRGTMGVDLRAGPERIQVSGKRGRDLGMGRVHAGIDHRDRNPVARRDLVRFGEAQLGARILQSGHRAGRLHLQAEDEVRLHGRDPLIAAERADHGLDRPAVPDAEAVQGCVEQADRLGGYRGQPVQPRDVAGRLGRCLALQLDDHLAGQMFLLGGKRARRAGRLRANRLRPRPGRGRGLAGRRRGGGRAHGLGLRGRARLCGARLFLHLGPGTARAHHHLLLDIARRARLDPERKQHRTGIVGAPPAPDGSTIAALGRAGRARAWPGRRPAPVPIRPTADLGGSFAGVAHEAGCRECNRDCRAAGSPAQSREARSCPVRAPAHPSLPVWFHRPDRKARSGGNRAPEHIRCAWAA
jgi:hypothetical protein